MQQFLTAFSCLLVVAAGFRSADYYVGNYRGGGRLPPGALSKREAAEEADPSATSQDLYKLTKETLENASRGVSAEELEDRAEAIQILAGAIQRAPGVNVSRDDVRNKVNDLAAQLKIQISLADLLFDGSLSEAASKVGTALRLLQRLREEGISLEAAGQPTDVTVATIQAVAAALEREVEKIVGIVTFAATANQEDDEDDGRTKDVDKRQLSGTGEVSFSKGSGWSGSVGLKWRFR
ncbi:hypothetical protein BsWGS_17511 [Bradybaena similaris]